MPIFNPDVPNVSNQDFLGYSRGIEPNRAGELAYKEAGVGKQAVGDLKRSEGQLFEDASKAAYKYYDTKIGEEVRDSMDPLREQHITKLAGTAYAGYAGATGVEAEGARQIPPELKQRLQYLTNITGAKAADKVPDSYYWMLMESEAKRLRNKYPGFKDEVDKHTSQLLGANPANRAIAELQQEAKSAGSSEEKYYQHWVQKFIDAGGVNKYEARLRSGKPMTVQELIVETGYIQRDKAQEEIQRNALTKAREQNAVNREVARNAAQQLVSNRMNSALSMGYDSQGIPSYQDFASKLQSMTTKEGPYSADEKTQIRKDFGQIRSFVINQTHAELARVYPDGFSYDANLHPDDKKGIIKGVEERLDMLGEALVNKDFGILLADKAYIDAVKNTDVAQALKNWPVARTAQAVKELWGAPMLGSTLMQAEGGRFLSETHRAITTMITGKVAEQGGGGPPVRIQQEFDTLKKQGLAEPKAMQAIFDNAMHTLRTANPGTQEKQAIKDYVDFIYGAGNEDFLFKKDKDGRIVSRWGDKATALDVYTKMVSDPLVVNNIRAVGGETWNKFKNTAISEFPKLMTSFANDAQKIVTDSRYQTVDFNPETMQFQIRQVAAYPPQGEFSDIIERSINDPARAQSVNQINRTIQALIPIIEKDGGNPKALIPQLISNLSIDESKTKRGPGMTALWETIENGFMRMIGRPPVTGPGSETGTRPQDVADILDLTGKLEGGKGGYNAVYGRAPNPNLQNMTLQDVRRLQDDMVKQGSKSSAIGKYQFIRSTFDLLSQDMGLDPGQPFSADLQDRMAVRLLERRGLNQYINGDMSKQQFAIELAKEWRSLPDPRTGLTYNDKDANLNKALVAPKVILDLIDRIPVRKKKETQ